MRRLFKYIIILYIATLTTGCFEEKEKIITTTPNEEISSKLKELRELQREVNDVNVEYTDLQAKIDQKINEINALVPSNTVPITYSIGIVSTNLAGQTIGIPDAVVTLHVRGDMVKDTTGTDGQVVFSDLRSGVVLVHISVEGYTDANFVSDLLVTTADDYKATGEDFNVSSSMALYPTTAENGALAVNGSLFFDPDRSDDVLPADPEYGIVNYQNSGNSGDEFWYQPPTTLIFTDGVQTGTSSSNIDTRVQTWEPIDQALKVFGFVQPRPQDYGFIAPGTPGNIILAIYEEMFNSTSSDPSSGKFQLLLPVINKSTGGNDIIYHFEEFQGIQTYVRTADTNTSSGNVTVSLRERNVLYTAMYMYNGNSYFGPGVPLDHNDVNNFIDNRDADELNYTFYFGAKKIDE